MKPIDVINQCIERKTTAPFFRLCLQWIKEEKPTEQLEGFGAAAQLTPEQVAEHIQMAQDMAPRINQGVCKQISRRQPSGNTTQEKIARQRLDRAREARIQKLVDEILARMTLGPKTKERIAKALLDTWRKPDLYSDSPAWKALINERNT